MDVYQMTTKSEGMMILGKLKWYTILALALWLAFSGMAAAEQLYVNESGWWRVDGAFNASGAPIQAAVDNATAGEMICVAAGSYTENVNVDKPRLTLEGEGGDVVTVTAANSGDHVFEVTADYVNISMFTVTGAASFMYAGIYLDGVDHCNIYENNCSNNGRGICLESSSDNTLANNTANSNNICGICLFCSSYNTLESNTMSGNAWNFGVFGYSLSEYTQNIDTSNTVDGKSIYYWVDQKDWQIPSNAGFVGVVNGTNITVRDLTLTDNWKGVLFAYTENSRIENVTVSSNYDGICLHSSSNNTLASNTALDNYDGVALDDSSNNTLVSNTANSNNDDGIQLDDSSNNTLVSNTANSNKEEGIQLSFSSNNTLVSNTANSNNDRGIRLYKSSSNLIYNNYFNNTRNAYDDGSNHWDSGSVGNYYSDYNGADLDGDGIGEDSYSIPGGESIDRFPLMHPWTGDTPQKGDLNGDGKLTPADVAIALQIAVGSRPCDPTTLAAADVSGDNRITSLDALMILQAADHAIDL
ncbi:MAG: hypothetical protein C4B59_14970 [Candidatus Methanogaster sp.]|uniref:Uncharacterized protein n=1 Tax=Candidatus Methanogaster sp. TaxID=3386292 RepID=A0AC61KZ79_9EURY|nr:MAG: hypothetical protein C4B59_14970 [ANME-2 cluster archaeon]